MIKKDSKSSLKTWGDDTKINEQGAQIGELRVRVEERMVEIGSRNKVDQQNGIADLHSSSYRCVYMYLHVLKRAVLRFSM